ncbi:MAG: hypothetical protein WDO13_05415 [Verrucomicrobiota bacterium]
MKSLFVVAVGALLACPVLAQDATNAPPAPPPPGEGGPGGHHHHHDMFPFLTDAEKAQYKKDHDAVFAADPTLATEGKDLMGQMRDSHDAGEPPSPDLMAKFKAFQDKVNAAMVKLDPSVEPIIDKIKAHHPPHGGPGGGPPPPPPDSGT